jgi:hypothetical protein
MKKISLIFSADYDFQIIRIVLGDSTKAWDIANELYEGGEFKDAGIEHYDVVEFEDEITMNGWIAEEVKESRKNN